MCSDPKIGLFNAEQKSYTAPLYRHPSLVFCIWHACSISGLKKSTMYHHRYVPFFLALFALILSGISVANAQHTDHGDGKNIQKIILHHDSIFWAAYNACDEATIIAYFTEDVEFYHDKSGLTTGSATLAAAIKKGLCGNPDFRLRREAVEGTVKVYPLGNYGAIISGDHFFYINEKGQEERVDGLAKFTHVWLNKDNTWRMARVLSYDHGPAPYRNTRKEIPVAPSLLKQYAGEYSSAQVGKMTIIPEGNTLKLSAGKIQATLFPETETLFFLKERDLQFEFIRDKTGKVLQLSVIEHGNKVEDAKKLR
jgi:hypothetical protein